MTVGALFRDPSFANAAGDYLWLRERGYPDSQTLALVGNRYRLSRIARNVLYRGVVPREVAERRRRRIIRLSDPAEPVVRSRPEAADSSSSVRDSSPRLVIDGYNVLLTILNYRLGHPVFLCLDGMTRDSGGAGRRFNRWSTVRELLPDFVEFLSDLLLSGVDIILDQQFSGSNVHRQAIEEAFTSAKHSFSCQLLPAADRVVADMSTNRGNAILCTADATIIDGTDAALSDLPREFLELKFNAHLASLTSLFTDNEQ